MNHWSIGSGLRNYSLRHDVPAGLAVAAVALPSAIAYPAIAGLPPVVGIYSSIVPLVAYAVFGSSRKLMLGPDAATMTMLAATLGVITAQGDRIIAASAMAMMVGLFCITARIARLGVIANFLSRPILVGFMAGISLSILVGQLGRFTGMKIHGEGLLPPLLDLARRTDEINWPSLALGVVAFAVLQVLRRSRAPGPVVVVVASALISAMFNFQGMGIAVVGAIPSALPILSTPVMDALPVLPLKTLVLGSAAVFLVSFGAGIITARSFGASTNEYVDTNRELVGFGCANIATAMFGGFPITASDSRTAINLSSGGTSQMAGLVAAAALLATLLILGGALHFLPIPALGAILVAAAISLIDISAMRQLWKISRIEFAFAVVTLFGTISLGVLEGVVIALLATLGYLLLRSMAPRDALLGRIPGRGGFYKLHRNAEARPVPHLTLIAIQGSLLFYNTDTVRERLESIARRAPHDTRWFILDASTIPFIDSTAAAMIDKLCGDLAKRGIKLGIAELNAEARHLLRAAGVLRHIGKKMIFEDVEEIEEALDKTLEAPPEDDA
jgi:SulP family sulfate permease